MANKSVKEFEFSPAFGFTGSAGKTHVKPYMRGGRAAGPKACACGGKAMKKGGSSKLSKSEKKMAAGLIDQIARQASKTGRMPGVPSPRARAVPVAPQAPLIAMKKGGAKVGKVMREFGKGELHSGSKNGPVVKDKKQALAIALSQAGK